MGASSCLGQGAGARPSRSSEFAPMGRTIRRALLARNCTASSRIHSTPSHAGSTTSQIRSMPSPAGSLTSQIHSLMSRAGSLMSQIHSTPSPAGSFTSKIRSRHEAKLATDKITSTSKLARRTSKMDSMPSLDQPTVRCRPETGMAGCSHVGNGQGFGHKGRSEGLRARCMSPGNKKGCGFPRPFAILMVERRGIEPLTSTMRTWRSPS